VFLATKVMAELFTSSFFLLIQTGEQCFPNWKYVFNDLKRGYDFATLDQNKYIRINIFVEINKYFSLKQFLIQV